MARSPIYEFYWTNYSPAAFVDPHLSPSHSARFPWFPWRLLILFCLVRCISHQNFPPLKFIYFFCCISFLYYLFYHLFSYFCFISLFFPISYCCCLYNVLFKDYNPMFFFFSHDTLFLSDLFILLPTRSTVRLGNQMYTNTTGHHPTLRDIV